MRVFRLSFSTIALIVALSPNIATACGGFFCETLPIDQAGEQIVFKQEGDSITAMVRILYEGDAERFSWIVPVPSAPEISVGSDSTFDQLEFATRPQFFLERRGNECAADDGTTGSTTGGVSVADAFVDAEGGVTIEQTLSVGPFEIQVVSSENPDDLAIWLTDNNYDLSDRGRELIEPYVLEGMQFVAVKLRSGESSGSIQPLIMKYKSDQPMIPIRLTAIAAQDDMGVLVWVVKDARAVPDNYAHVIPNYTHLNWFAGSRNAYASYQSLITDAMNEAGGQGFATDLAGRIDGSITGFLFSASELDGALNSIDSDDNDASFIAQAAGRFQAPTVLTALQNLLPLRAGQDTNIYFDQFSLQSEFTAEQLATARTELRSVIVSTQIEPVRASNALLTEGSYLTRLYTTLSADEMTLDPTFTFNADMPDQPLSRNAVLQASCGDNGTEWSLTLGAGTGRDGEVVMIGNSDIPIVAPPEVLQQEFTYRIERTSADAMPEVTVQANYQPVQVGATEDDSSDGLFGLGAQGLASSFAVLIALGLRRRRRNQA